VKKQPSGECTKTPRSRQIKGIMDCQKEVNMKPFMPRTIIKKWGDTGNPPTRARNPEHFVKKTSQDKKKKKGAGGV